MSEGDVVGVEVGCEGSALGSTDGVALGATDGSVLGVADGVVLGSDDGVTSGDGEAQWSSFTPPSLGPCSSQSAPRDGCGSGLHDCWLLPWSHSPCPGGLDGGLAWAALAPARPMASAATMVRMARFMFPYFSNWSQPAT